MRYKEYPQVLTIVIKLCLRHKDSVLQLIIDKSILAISFFKDMVIQVVALLLKHEYHLRLKPFITEHFDQFLLLEDVAYDLNQDPIF